MSFNNRTANRQAHPHAPRLYREEWVKNLFAILRVDPSTCVCNRNDYFAVFAKLRRHRKNPSPLRSRHGIDGIRNQIQDHLLQLKELYESHLLALRQKLRQKEQIDSKFYAAGYDIAYDGKLRVKAGGEITLQLKAFNDRAEEMLKSLKSLKRNYVIKLFADHADTQSLSASLASDLERLIG
jgi:hypothetical protein